MNLEQQLLDLLISSPNTKKIQNMAEELEKESKFTLSRDIEKLKGIWELRSVSYTHLTLPTIYSV